MAVLDPPVPAQRRTEPPPDPSPPPKARQPRQIAPYLFMAPAMLGILLFVVIPAVLSFLGSFFSIPLAPGADWHFVGLDNYQSIFQDPVVRKAVRNTVVYCVITIVPSLAIGLFLALLAENLGRANAWVRTALFLPMTANLVAMAVVFRYIFSYQGGLANQLLGYLGVAPLNWLNDTRYSLISVAIVGVWRGAAFTMLLFLAGLSTIPAAVHEAAASEGIRGWAKLRNITLPMMRPTLVFATVLSILTSVQVFDTINVMTPNGGPQNSTLTVMVETWQIGFSYFQLGRAAALSFLLLAVLIGIGLLRRGAFSADQR